MRRAAWRPSQWDPSAPTRALVEVPAPAWSPEARGAGHRTVGRAVGGRLDELGHEVTIGTRDAADTAARDDYAAWAADHPDVGLVDLRGGRRGRELVVNASGGAVALGIIDSAGTENLAGKVLLDISNPLDGSTGFPPPSCASRTTTPSPRRSSAPIPTPGS